MICASCGSSEGDLCLDLATQGEGGACRFPGGELWAAVMGLSNGERLCGERWGWELSAGRELIQALDSLPASRAAALNRRRSRYDGDDVVRPEGGME